MSCVYFKFNLPFLILDQENEENESRFSEKKMASHYICGYDYIRYFLYDLYATFGAHPSRI